MSDFVTRVDDELEEAFLFRSRALGVGLGMYGLSLWTRVRVGGPFSFSELVINASCICSILEPNLYDIPQNLTPSLHLFTSP
jgi:hypothetical protein